MSKLIDLTGKTFGRLKVIKRKIGDSYINGEALWECECSCIKKTIVYVHGSELRQGRKKSCGCIWKPEKKEYLNKIHARLIQHSTLNVLTQCIEWTGYKDKDGYGKISITQNGKERPFQTHRVSWMVHGGTIPPNMFILHSCDNPSCIRIDHLFLGTHQENIDDKMRKGRHIFPTGADCKQAILSENKAQKILNMKGKGKTSHEIAKYYKIAASTVRSIWQRRSWKHLK